MGHSKYFFIFFVSLIWLCGCDNCHNMGLQANFSENDYVNFPIFNKIVNKDTVHVKYITTTGLRVDLYYGKAKMEKGFNSSKRLRTTQGASWLTTGNCERENYIQQSAYLAKRKDSTGYLSLNIYKCTTINNAPDPCPDSIQFRTLNRFVGDTMVNGKLFKGVRELRQKDYGSYSLVNLDDGVFYFELTSSGEKYWKVP